MASKPIFVSHAVKDKALVDELVDLFVAGGVASADDFFCSSLEGLGIPKGQNFVDFIQSQLQKPRLVILVLTPHYWDSNFCLCELGAAWVLSHSVYPLLVPPLEFADLRVVLSGVEAGKINDESALNDLKDLLVETLGTKPHSSRWEVKRDKFLANIAPIIKSSGKPTKVEYAKFDEMQTKYKDALSELKKDEEEIERLNDLVAKLKRAKNAKEVNKLMTENMDEWAQFEHLVGVAKKRLDALPSCVHEAILHELIGSSYSPNAFNNEAWEDIRAAEASDFLVRVEGSVEPNGSDPKVSRAQDALHALSVFLENASEEFTELYVEKYDHAPKIRNQQLWNSLF